MEFDEVVSPFGESVRELKMPPWLLQLDQPQDELRAEVLSQEDEVTHLRIEGKPFRYDRLGYRPESADRHGGFSDE